MIAWLAAVPAAYADTTPDSCSGVRRDCVAIGQWNFTIGVGLGIRTNPLPSQRNIPMIFMPQFSYYRKRFFLDNLDVGYTLVEGAHNTVSLLATPSYDLVFFKGKPLYDTLLGENLDVAQALFSTSLHDLGTTTTQSLHHPIDAIQSTLPYLGGFEWTTGFGAALTQVDVLRQPTASAGLEVRAAIGVPVQLRRGVLNVNVGGTWKSRSYLEYEYGPYIPRGSSTPEGRSAFSSFITIRYSLPLATHWRLGPYVQYEHLWQNEVGLNNNYVFTTFLGMFYDF